MSAIDDLENAVTNVIADTRRERRYPDRRGVDLGDIVRERLKYWEVLTHAQQRRLDIRLYPDRLPVAVNRRDLEELVDVLLGNVLRHAAPGATARVTTRIRTRGGGHLIVEDAGAGFDTKIAGAARGSGRGLDIARRIAESAGGSVSIGRSDLGGARVDVGLGPQES